jgi:transcriptional antiterminator RfaH
MSEPAYQFNVERTMAEWYLVHTKAQLERRVHERLKISGMDALLPLLKRHVRRWGRLVKSVGPLFPCYLFVLPRDRQDRNAIDLLPGVRGLVRFGGELSPVPHLIIEELKQRCAAGPVELPSKPLKMGGPVRVTHGPFRNFEGIFERHLSGTERVAILFSTLQGAVRMVLPTEMVVSDRAGSS